MANRYFLSEADKRIIERVVRTVLAGKVSQRPLPTRRRREGAGGRRMNVVHGQAVGAMSGSTHTIDNIEVMNGRDPREDTSSTTETVSVLNPFGYDTDDNGKVRAEQADNGDWIVTDAECPA